MYSLEAPSKNEVPIEEQLRQSAKDFIMKEVIKKDKLLLKALHASREKFKDFSRALDNFDTPDGYYAPNAAGHYALQDLDSKVKQGVWAHGVSRGSKEEQVNSLIEILYSGTLKGDTAPLEGGFHPTFTNAPFVLLSNYDENGEEGLASHVSEGEMSQFRITNLRTVLVNGEFEDIIEDLKTAFPGVSFRKASEINDSVFEIKSEMFTPWAQKAEEMVKRRLLKIKKQP